MGIPIAVISNASLVGRADVRAELAQADWVSLKTDAVSEEIWRRTNRPHGKLQLASIQEGMLAFARDYEGQLMTETMLVRDTNDSEEALRAVADFLARLEPDGAYLAIPVGTDARPSLAPCYINLHR